MESSSKRTESGGKSAPSSPLPIVFDTSILSGVKVDSPSPEFRLLQRLREGGKVTLHVPEMAVREWLSQRCEPAQQALDRLKAALQDIRRHPSIADQAIAKKIDASADLGERSFQELSRTSNSWHLSQVNRLGLSLIPFELSDLKGTIDGYIAGELPFSGKKARKDIPDGLVVAGTLRVLKSDAKAIFACNDERLRRAASERGMTVAESLPELLKLEAVSSLHSNPAFALWWEANLASALSKVSEQKDKLDELLSDHLIEAVGGSEITHGAIPDDNNEARVTSVGDVSDISIDWAKAESLGEGVVSVPMKFEVYIELEFYVYRGEAFDVPDWVKVSYGDLEEDHYFEAYGSRNARYLARLVLGLPESVMAADLDLAKVDIAVEDVELDDFA